LYFVVSLKYQTDILRELKDPHYLPLRLYDRKIEEIYNHSPTIFTPVQIDTTRLKIRPLSAVSREKVTASVLYEDSFHNQICGMKMCEDIKKSYVNSLVAFENKKGTLLVFLSLDESEVHGKTNFMNVEPHNKMIEIGGTWVGKK
jgi:hypothetical protein